LPEEYLETIQNWTDLSDKEKKEFKVKVGAVIKYDSQRYSLSCKSNLNYFSKAMEDQEKV
jgi:hypothetical protein